MEQSKVTLRKSVEADYATYESGKYVKVTATFWAKMIAHENGWTGWYENRDLVTLTRNGTKVMVHSESPVELIKLLSEAVQVISLEIPEDYLESINNDDNN